MAARDVAEAITQTNENKSEAQADAETSDGRAGEYGTAAGEQYEEHGAGAFGDILFNLS